MALALNKQQFAFKFNTIPQNTEDIWNSVKRYIEENDCPELTMDISNLNIIDASKVTILSSTYHWAKYPHGHICLQTSSDEVKELVSSLNPGNIIFQ